MKHGAVRARGVEEETARSISSTQREHLHRGSDRSANAKRAWLEAAGVAVASVALLALRAPFAMQRLWAEDGSVFLQQVINGGVIQPFGRAYAGYYLFLPRVIGAIGAAVPIRDAAFATWAAVAATIAWCAATIYVEASSWLETRPSRLVIASSVVLLPALGYEAIANSSTLQFTLLFTALIALTGFTVGRWSAVNRALIVAVTGLTTPLALTLAPIAVARVLIRRPRRIDTTAAAWAIASAIELGMILYARPRRVGSQLRDRLLVLSSYAHNVVSMNVLPKRVSLHGPGVVVNTAAVCFVCFVLLGAGLAWRRGRRSQAVLIVLVPATGFGFWVFALMRSGLYARYLVLPACSAVWSILAATEEVARSGNPRGRADWRPVAVVAALVVLSWTTYWTPSPWRRSGPSWSAALATAERRCERDPLRTVVVATSPLAGGRTRWFVRLSCQAVDDAGEH